MLGYGPGPWRSRFIFNLNMQFLSKKFPFPLITAKGIGDYFDIRRCGAEQIVRCVSLLCSDKKKL